MATETTQPRYSEDVLQSVEQQMRAHNMRLKPGETVEGIMDALAADGVKFSVEHGHLIAETATGIGGVLQPAHAPRIFEAAAAKHATKFFPRDVSDAAKITGKDELDPRAASQYIAAHGLAAYESLPLKSQAAQPVELNPRRMTRQQWLSLPVKTRAELSGTWGRDAVGAIMNRK